MNHSPTPAQLLRILDPARPVLDQGRADRPHPAFCLLACLACLGGALALMALVAALFCFPG